VKDFKASFGISPDDDKHIIHILRDKLYSNKIRAVVREYCTNAQDAHKEAGIKRPIRVDTPGTNALRFNVRDYGEGLSQDDIAKIYTQYGKSTKRSCSITTGQLGLGCKSAFAYTDAFTITSFFKGTKTIYTAFLDDSGLGAIKKVSSEPAPGETGVSITIPVKPNDLWTFQREAGSVLMWFDPQPKGLQLVEPPVFTTSLGKREYFADSRECSAPGENYALMGGVRYPILTDTVRLPSRKVQAALQAFFKSRVTIKFDVDQIDVTPSREHLEYTKKTNAALRRAYFDMYKTARRELEAIVASQTSFVNAVKEVRRLSHNHRFNAHLLQDPRPTWKGSPVKNSAVDMVDGQHLFTGGNHIACVEIASDTAAGFRKDEVSSIPAWRMGGTNNFHIALDDSPSKWIKRSLIYLKSLETEENPHPVLYVMRFCEEDADALINFYGLDPSSYKRLSEVEAKTTRKNKKTGPKYEGQCFLLKKDQVGRWLTTKSLYWTPAVDPEPDLVYGNGIFAELDYFFVVLRENPVDKHRSSRSYPRDLKEYMGVMEACGVKPMPEIYGFKAAMVPKLGPGWRRIEDITATLVKKRISESDELSLVVNESRISERWNSKSGFIANEAISLLDMNSPFRKFCVRVTNLLEDAKTVNRKDMDKILDFAKGKMSGSPPINTSDLIDMAAEIDIIYTRYPLLKHMDLFHQWRHVKHEAKDVVAYVALVDHAHPPQEDDNVQSGKTSEADKD
jgi:hypothetical protein